MAIPWTIEQLKSLVMVADVESFTRAAEEMSLSQPAVSVQIRTLERAVGAQLLERRPRRVVLTDAGRILYGYAKRILNTEAEFSAELSDLRNLEQGLLRVGAGATPSIFTLAGLFAEYYSRWPGVELQVRIGRTSELVQRVLDDTLDLAIIASDTGVDGLERKPIYRERCVVIAGSQHPLYSQKKVTLQELSQHPLVMLPAESGLRKFLQKTLADQQTTLNAAMELASLEAIKEVVRTGVLASIVPETAVFGESRESGLHMLEISGTELTRQTVAIQRSDKYMSEAMKAFYALLEEHWPVQSDGSVPFVGKK